MFSNRNCGLKIGVALLAVVVVAALIAPVRDSPTEQPYRALALTGPSAQHWLGVDGAGRDVLTRILFGARVTLGIALGATLIAIGGGVLLGAMAGT
jgi:peptide/nickel transport system permease protein